MAEQISDIDDVKAEVIEERKDFDLFERLVNRPKRKPEVVDLYLNEELGQELGYARDERNELGVVVGRLRGGVLGELDAERAKGDEADEKVIKSLEARVRELVKGIKEDSLTVTLQWIPPIAEEVVSLDAKRAIGVKSGDVPQNKRTEFMKAWLDEALRATVVSVKDNKTGSVKDSLSLDEARALREYLPKSQLTRLDEALGRLLNRDAISKEALDNADF